MSRNTWVVSPSQFESTVGSLVLRAYVAASIALLLSALFGALPSVLHSFKWWFVIAILLLLVLAWVRRSGLKQMVSPAAALDQRLLVLAWVFLVPLAIIRVLSLYWSFQVNAYDFSFFDWALWGGAHPSKTLYNPVYEIGVFEQHSMPILWLLQPFYQIFLSPYVLLVLHALISVASAGVFWLLAGRFVSDSVWRTVLSLAFFHSPLLQRTLGYPIHPEFLYIPLLLGAFYFEDRKQAFASFCLLVVAVTIKEDSSFYVAAFGLGLLVAGRSAALAVSAIGLGGLSYWAHIHVLIPFVTGAPYRLLGHVGTHGSTAIEVAKYLLGHPIEGIKTLFSGGLLKQSALWLGLPWGAPLAIPGLLVGFGILSLSPNPTLKHLVLYYGAPVLPFLALGFLVTLAKLPTRWKQWAMPGLVLALTLLSSAQLELNFSVPHGAMLSSWIRNNSQDVGTACVQSSLFPHIAYVRDRHLLSEECLKQGPAWVLLAPDLPGFPHGRGEIERFREYLLEKGYLEEFQGPVRLLRRH